MTFWQKLQARFHYTTATLLAIVAAAITVGTTLGLHVNANARDAILQLAGLILGGVVVGGGVKSSGMLQAGIHPLQKAARKAAMEALNWSKVTPQEAAVVGRSMNDAREGENVTISLQDEPTQPPTPGGLVAPSGLAARHHVGRHSEDAHPILKAHGTFAGMPMGKLAAVHDPRTPLLAEFLRADVKLGIKLPSKTSLLDEIAAVLGGDFGMMGNDGYGDCTCAALGHGIQHWTGANGAPVTLTAAQILQLYWATGSKDDGRVMFEVLKYVHHNPLAGHKIGAYVAVGLRRYSNRDVKAAIDLFGGCYLGVGLPETAQSQQVWDVTGDPSKPGPAQFASWGGHAIWLGEYDRQGPTCVTWAHPLKMTWDFLDTYADEGYAIISPEWLKGDKSPQGFDGQALTEYLAKIKQGWQPPM